MTPLRGWHTSVSVSASGEAAPAVVWERYTRPSLWSTWSPQILGVTCSDERIVTGTIGTVRVPPGVTLRFEVTAVDEQEQSWSWVVHGPLGAVLRLDHGVQARPAPALTGSRTSLTIGGFAPLVLAYAPLAGPALRRLVRP